MIYEDYVKNKASIFMSSGMTVDAVNSKLFDFQRDITKWSLKRGKSCIFADCGFGKTPMQLAWADEVRKSVGDILIVAPLAVAFQTILEGQKFDVEVEYSRDGKKSDCGITIANYEMLGHFNPSDYSGVVLDESSILKSYTGKIRNEIIDMFGQTPYRLACTATPAPNDLMELGNHAEFVGAMSRLEMLSMFFVHDGGETQKWRLKGHAREDFWKWVCEWAVMIRKPSDLGYGDQSFILPPITIHEIVVEADHSSAMDTLFVMEANTLQERQKARRETIKVRCEKAAEIANASDEPWLIWCDRNGESELLAKLIPDSVEVKGSDNREDKELAILWFKGELDNHYLTKSIDSSRTLESFLRRHHLDPANIQKARRILISKPSIFGFGLNLQHCSKVIFVGLSDSYEQFYQAVRRSWRFGQKKVVDCYIITSSIEGAVVANIKRKEKQAKKMGEGMVANMHVYNENNIKGTQRSVVGYNPQKTMQLPAFLKGAI